MTAATSKVTRDETRRAVNDVNNRHTYCLYGAKTSQCRNVHVAKYSCAKMYQSPVLPPSRTCLCTDPYSFMYSNFRVRYGDPYLFMYSILVTHTVLLHEQTLFFWAFVNIIGDKASFLLDSGISPKTAKLAPPVYACFLPNNTFFQSSWSLGKSSKIAS